jgi:DNA-binding CsgD family transcriptional regulator
MTIGYAITLAFAVGLLIAYLIMVKNKEFWLTMLYACVATVNLGYLLLSLAKNVNFAIFANDVAYFGSVFLSMCMFLTIVRLCGFEVKKLHVIICAVLGVGMFAIIATSGFLPWYYKSVDIEIVDGATKLVKEYGVLHDVYLCYLLLYFIAMIVTIAHSVGKKKMGRPKFAGFIAGIVCSNIIVWAFEKFVSWEFEFLAVTYIISELLLLLVYWMMQDYVYIRDISKITKDEKMQLGVDIATMPMDVKIGKVLLHVKPNEQVSAREREILEQILNNKKRRDIAQDLHLSENTIKTYTRTLYAKIGVKSREELYALLLQ